MKIFNYLFSLILLLSFGCTSDEVDQGAKLNIAVSVEIPNTSGYYSLSFTTEGTTSQASASSDKTWLLAAISGKKITLVHEANPYDVTRTANITVTLDDIEQVVVVTQEAGLGSADPNALQLGDPGVTFDESLFDSNYPQMERWSEAGVRGGIPFVDEQTILVTLEDGADATDINSAISEAVTLRAAQGLETAAILLKNGTYDIDKNVEMKSGISIIGESRYGVICLINPTMGVVDSSGSTPSDEKYAFNFPSGVTYSGLYRLTIKGVWTNHFGEQFPHYNWNIGGDVEDEFGNIANNELDDNVCISIFLKGSEDCWVDDVDILNSADFPMRINSSHISMRNIYVDGCYNKHGGCHGYFYFIGSDNLLINSQITRIRHISIQGEAAEYNVLYNNDLHQEISFHSGDNGNNLIEYNRITLPADMPPGGEYGGPEYYAIMGAWSVQHENSLNPNFVYRNDCLHLNWEAQYTPWSDHSKIYTGPIEVKPADPLTNFVESSADLVPSGGTLYPYVLGFRE